MDTDVIDPNQSIFDLKQVMRGKERDLMVQIVKSEILPDSDRGHLFTSIEPSHIILACFVIKIFEIKDWVGLH